MASRRFILPSVAMALVWLVHGVAAYTLSLTDVDEAIGEVGATTTTRLSVVEPVTAALTVLVSVEDPSVVSFADGSAATVLVISPQTALPLSLTLVKVLPGETRIVATSSGAAPVSCRVHLGLPSPGQPLPPGFWQEALFLGPVQAPFELDYWGRLNWDPVSGGEAGLSPSEGRVQDTVTGPLAWYRHAANNGAAFNFIDATFPWPYEYMVVYAAMYVVSPEPHDCQLWVGSDDSEATWVNGQLVFQFTGGGRGLTLDQDQFDIHLNAGTNLLVIKVEQGWGGAGVSARLTSGGQDIPTEWGLTYSLQDVAGLQDLWLEPRVIELRTTQTAAATVRLSRLHPDAVTLELAAAGPPLVAADPPQVEIPAGTETAGFALAALTPLPGTGFLQATSPGLRRALMQVNLVNPTLGFACGAPVVELSMKYGDLGGRAVNVTIPDAIPAGEVTVQVESSDPALLTIGNPTVTVAPGQTVSAAPFLAVPTGRGPGEVVITATATHTRYAFTAGQLRVRLSPPSLRFAPPSLILSATDHRPQTVSLDLSQSSVPLTPQTFAVTKTGLAANSVTVTEPVTVATGAGSGQMTVQLSALPGPGEAEITLSNPLLGTATLGVLIYDPAVRSVVINEFLADNLTDIADEDGDHPDWIELLNLTDRPVDLAGFSLTDDPNQPQQWVFPELTLGPRGFLTVWASGKDRKTPSTEQVLSGGGAGIGGTADQLHFEYARITGDFTVTARVHGLQADDPWATVGVMARASPEAGSANLAMLVTRDYGFRVEARTTADTDAWRVDPKAGFTWPNAWVGLVRQQGRIAACWSTDGQSWVSAGDPVALPGLPDELCVGVCICSSRQGSLAVARISGYTPAPTEFTPLDVGDAEPAGSLTPFVYLHTGFKLAQSGERIALFAPDGRQLDEVSFDAQATDISMGRSPDGGSRWLRFAVPTPNAPNHTAAQQGVCYPPDFSVAGGFHEAPLRLELTTQTPGAEIRYTLDGAEPTPASPLYREALELTAPTAVRARAFRTDLIPSRVSTSTFLVGLDCRLAVLAIVTDPANLWDPNTGIYRNPWNRGRAWERPASVQFWQEDKALGWATGCGLRVQGGFSRGADKKSMGLYFRQEYGMGKLHYPLFPRRPENDDNDRLYIRAGGNDFCLHHPYWTLMRDALEQELARPCFPGVTSYRHVLVYLNGDPRGVYDIREDYDETFLENTYGFSDADLLKNGRPELGDADAWNQCWWYFWNLPAYDPNVGFDPVNAMTPENWATCQSYVDLDSISYEHIIRTFGADWDWPHNNRLCLRQRTANAKWQFLLWDLDWTFWLSDPNGNTLVNAARYDWSTAHFNRLLNSVEFRRRFLNLYADMLNSVYRPEHVVAKVDEIAAELHSDIHFETERWGGSPAQWQANVQLLRDFAAYRPPIVWGQLLAMFRDLTDGVSPLVVHEPQAGIGAVWVNTVRVDAFPWEGQYFNGVPITLRAEPAPGYRFVRWSDPRLPARPEVTLRVGPVQPNPGDVLVPVGATWRFSDSGLDLGTAWRANAYDDSAWPVGPAQLGYGDGDEATVVGYGPDPAAKYPTTYFRTTFEVAAAAAISSLTLSVVADDGLIVYLNGNRVWSLNLGDGEVGYLDYATTGVVGDDESAWHVSTPDPALLVSGTNTIAAEVHQVSGSSSDISFDLRLEVTRPGPFRDLAPEFERNLDPGSPRGWLQTGAAVHSSPAVGANGRVYVGSGDGRLYCCDADGDPIWSYATGAPVRSSPLLDHQGLIYVGSDDGCLYALRDDGPQATLLWRFAVDGSTPQAPYPVVATPALGPDGTVYCGADNGWFYALQPYGDPAFGTARWRFSVGRAIRAQALVLDDGGVVFGADDNRVYRLDASGQPVWAAPFDAGGDVRSSPAVGPDGTLYVGSDNNRLYALDPETGQSRWSFHAQANVRSSPVVGPDGTIYIGARDDGFYALDPSGRLTWSFQAPGNVDSTAAIAADGKVFVASKAGNGWPGLLYCFAPAPPDPQHVSPLWTHDFGGTGLGSGSSPVLAPDGTLYIGAEDSRLYAIWTGTAGLAASSWPMAGQNPRHTAQSPAVLGRVEAPALSQPGGQYATSLALTLSSATAGGTIYYAIDGADPTPDSTRYLAPIEISRTTLVRARAFAAGLQPSRIVTAFYLVGETSALPMLSIATPPSNLWGATGLYDNPHQRDWERPAAITYITAEGVQAFSENCGLRIHGGSNARSLPKKSFGLYFRGSYGLTRLHARLFADKPDVNDFDALIVNAGANDQDKPTPTWTLVRDRLMHRLAAQTGLGYCASQPILLYLNGEFWGVYALRENVDARYLAENYGVDTPFLLSAAEADGMTVEAGGAAAQAAWTEMFAGFTGADPTAAAQIDVAGFIDTQLVRLYGADINWPQGNDFAFRGQAPGATWRWLMGNTDAAFGRLASVRHDTLGWAGRDHPRPDLHWADSAEWLWSTVILRQLLSGSGHREAFAQRLNDLLGSTLSSRQVLAQIDELEAQLEPEMGRETARWGSSSATWHNHVEQLRDFARLRPAQLRARLAAIDPAYTNLTAVVAAAPVGGTGVTRINTVSASSYPGSVDVAAGTTLSLAIRPDPGFRFRDWGDAGLPPQNPLSLPTPATTATALVAADSVWEYRDRATPPPDAWCQPGSALEPPWSAGSAPLGGGDVGTAVATPLDLGSATQRTPSFYFRQTFTVVDPAVLGRLTLNLRRDDGAAVYLNGVEVLRTNLPAGPLSFSTYAESAATGDDENAWWSVQLDPALLVPGPNLIAAEVHQANDGGSDALFQLELEAGTAYRVQARLEPDLTVAGAASLPWTFETGAAIRSSPAVAPDGTVYFGADDHCVYALWPDGRLKWRYRTGAAVLSSPAIGLGGSVYVGSQDGSLYALRPDGSLEWRFEDPLRPLGRVDATPALGRDGTVYFGAENGVFYALTPNGEVRWRFVEATANIQSQAAISLTGTVIFGCDDGFVRALDDRGDHASLAWSFACGSRVRSSLTLDAESRAYFGDWGDSDATGRLLCLDREGHQVWEQQVGRVRGSPSLAADGSVCVGTRTGMVYALEPIRGAVRWAYQTAGPVDSAPAVAADGAVYVCSADGNLYALDLAPTTAAGVVRWALHLGGDPPSSESSPALTPDGTLYVGADNGWLYAVATGSPGAAASPWPMFGLDPRHGGYAGSVARYALAVAGGSGSGTYRFGDVVRITPEVRSGYRFGGWTGNTAGVADVLAADTTVTITADAAIEATFVRQFRLDIRAGTGSGTYDTGTLVTIAAAVPDGSRFDRWTGDTAGVADVLAADTTVTITADATIEAHSVPRSAPQITEGDAVDVGCDEDSSPVPFALALHAADPDGDPLVWRLAVPPRQGVAELGQTGTAGETQAVGYTPDHDANGSDAFQIEVSDGTAGGTDTILVRVAIRPRNDPPLNTTLPGIIGSLAVGAGLTADAGGWSDATDMTPGTITYEFIWLSTTSADGAGAVTVGTGPTYTVPAAIEGQYLSVRVTATDDGEGEPVSQSAIAVSRFAGPVQAAPRFDLALTPGWNLFSLPLQPVDPHVAAVLTLTRSAYEGSVWRWSPEADGKYAAVGELQALTGYWVWVGTAGAVRVTGTAVNPTVDLNTGWNLVGPAQPVTAPASPSVLGPCWRWDVAAGTYVRVVSPATLQPGVGYWLFSTQPGPVRLSP